MKNTNISFIGILVAIVLTLCSLSTFAEESQGNTHMNKDQVESFTY